MLFFYTTSILNNFLTSWIMRFNYQFRWEILKTRIICKNLHFSQHLNKTDIKTKHIKHQI